MTNRIGRIKRGLALFVFICIPFGTLTFGADEPRKEAVVDNAQTQEEILTNDAVIDLLKLGLSEKLIIEKIKASQCHFDVSISGLKKT